MFSRRRLSAAIPIAATLALVAGSAAVAQSPSAPFEGRWTGQGRHGPVEVIIAPGGAVTMTSSGAPVDLAPPTYSDGKMVVKTRAGGLEVTVVPEGRGLKATNHALANNQKWDVMLTRVSN